MPRVSALLLTVTFGVLAALPARAVELLMVEQPGCHYCIAWKEQIGPIYPKTEQGEFAPLRMIDIRQTGTSGLDLDGPVIFTPTFILLDEGKEIDRLEGYPGEDFFWGLLDRMLIRNTAFPAPAATN